MAGCVFGDILDRMPASFRNELTRLAQVRDEKVETMLDAGQEASEVYSSVGNEFVAKVISRKRRNAS